jgi:uncharacterized pyridoxal phosphate-containing UPF0001 family protein
MVMWMLNKAFAFFTASSKSFFIFFIQVPNLFVIESIDSIKLASKVNDACRECEREPLSVFVQINTSGEDSKSGLSLDGGESVMTLAKHIKENCPHLKLAGLMTIGAADGSSPIPYFKVS